MKKLLILLPLVTLSLIFSINSFADKEPTGAALTRAEEPKDYPIDDYVPLDEDGMPREGSRTVSAIDKMNGTPINISEDPNENSEKSASTIEQPVSGDTTVAKDVCVSCHEEKIMLIRKYKESILNPGSVFYPDRTKKTKPSNNGEPTKTGN